MANIARNLINPYNVDNTTGIENRFPNDRLADFSTLPRFPTRGNVQFPQVGGSNTATTGNPGFDQKPITGRVLADPTKRGDEKKIREGDFLFCLNSNDNVKREGLQQGREHVMSLWTLNYELEAAARLKQENIKNSTISSKKRGYEPKIIFPTTLEEFNATIKYLGPIMTDNPYGTRIDSVSGSSDMKMFAVDYKGRGRVSNLWGPNVAEGDWLGFTVKEIESPYSAFFGIDGKTIGGKTTGIFLQVLPVWFYGGKYPTMCSQVQSPQEFDTLYKKNKKADQKVYASNPSGGGLFDPTQELEKKIHLEYIDVIEGRVFRVGQALKIGLPPNTEVMKMALRSHSEYRRLWAEQYIELEAYPMGDVPFHA
jgi:hypothetical protein